MKESIQTPRRSAVRGIAIAAGAAAVLTPLFASDAQAGRTAVVLTGDNRLARFDTDSPNAVSGSVAVSGLDADESLLGIDFRPAQPGQLFGLSSFGQLYRLNVTSGSATKVGVASDPAALPLAGGSFGFDFNPVVDRIRLVSDVGENARLNPDTGAAVDSDMDAGNGVTPDGDLAFAAGDANEGEPSGVTSVAYTNNDNDATTGTELYGLDSAFGVLVSIDPPNDGTLNTIGSTGQDDLPLFSGFDIFGADEAFAVTTAEGAFGSLPALSARLFDIDLVTGAASELGVIGDGSLDIAGFALSDTDFGGGPTPIPLPAAVFAFPFAAAIAGYFHRRARRAMANA